MNFNISDEYNTMDMWLRNFLEFGKPFLLIFFYGIKQKHGIKTKS